MPFTIPDKGEGLNDIQSIYFQEYIEILTAGIARTSCVLTGCAVTAQATPDMTVAVVAGVVKVRTSTLFLGVLEPKAVTAANATITAADATNPRIDLVCITNTGSIVVSAGTAAAAPKPPARVVDVVVIAAIYIPAGATAINANQITDMRVFGDPYEQNIKVLNGDVTNDNATANTIANVDNGATNGILQFPVDANAWYTFKFVIPYTSAATTTGSRWAITGPTLGRLNMVSTYTLTATSQTTNFVSEYDTPTAANATSTLAGNVAIMEGVIQCTAAGYVIARFASEIASSAITAKKGAYVQYRRLIA